MKECVNAINKGLEVYYILPSREAMFHTRKLFAREGCSNCGCHVMSFDDLERFILGEKSDTLKTIRNIEKQLLLKEILGKLPEDMAFDKVKDKQGFFGALINTIRQLKRLGISPEEFIIKTERLTGNLIKKCEGLQFIYSSYEKAKEEKGLADLDDISIWVVEAGKRTKIFDNTGIIVIDGFFNIDPVNIKLLESILKSYPHISFYTNVPFKNINNEQFLMQEVLGDFSKLGFETIIAESSENSAAPFLKSISGSIYSGRGSITASLENFRICNSPCMDHEIRTAAGRIAELIQIHGAKPSDIAIISVDALNSNPRLFGIFSDYGIPLSLGEQVKLSSIPLVKDAMALWRLGIANEQEAAFVSIFTSKYLLPIEILSEQGFRTDKLFKICKNILKCNEQSDLLEAFFNEYTKNTENEQSWEALRKFIDEVQSIREISQKRSADAMEAFIKFLETIQIEKRIPMLYSEEILDYNMQLRDMEAIKQLSDFIHRLDKIYRAYNFGEPGIGPEDIIREIYNITFVLDTAEKEENLQGVKIMTPDMARGQTYDTVFILGVNEGIFPAAEARSSLFNNYEIKEISKAGMNLGTSEWELEREKLRFNSCIAAARKRLYLSYRTADEDGNVMIASPFIDEVISLLDEESSKKVVEGPVSMRERLAFPGEPRSTNEAARKIIYQIKSDPDFDKSTIDVEMRLRLKYPFHAAAIESSREFGSTYDNYDGRLQSPVLAQQDADYGFSASQLNSYSRCPFIYFAQRVLELEQEDDSMREMMDTGTFYHEVLKDYHEGNKNPCEPDIERLKGTFDRRVSKLHLDSIPYVLEELFREELFEILKAFIIHDAENMSRYYETTGCMLKPVILEEGFSITIGRGNSIIRGAADRIDFEVNEKGAYTGRFIIYDYKKGGIKGIKECIEGSDFQLPMYNVAFRRILKEKYKLENPECMALLYYSIEKLEWNGIIRKDIKKALFEGRKGTKSTPDRENMELVLSWAEKEAAAVIDRIRKGHFMPPKKCPASDMFGCFYSGMCRYDSTRLAHKVGEKCQ